MSALRAAVHALVDSLSEEHLATAAMLLGSLDEAPVSPDEAQGIRRGIAAAGRGELVEADEVLAHGKARVDAARQDAR